MLLVLPPIFLAETKLIYRCLSFTLFKGKKTSLKELFGYGRSELVNCPGFFYQISKLFKVFSLKSPGL